MRQESASTGLGYLSIIPGSTLKRFDIVLGFDGTNTQVSLYGQSGAFLPAATIQGNGYQVYNLVYSPATQTADLFINGVLRYSGYGGNSLFLEGRGVVFGNFAGDPAGSTNFNYVRFSSPAPLPGDGNVPEPSTWLLAGCGLIGAGLIRWRR